MSYNGSPTKFQEPPITRVPKGASIEGRWTWWFSALADAMIRHPDKRLKDIAVMLNKSPNYISMIVNTDLFKEYLAQRKEAWRVEHDHALRAKLTDVAHHGLDIILDKLQTQKSQIPLSAAKAITESALDRLGYAPDSSPAVVVNNSVQDNRQQSVTINGLSASDLEDARNALRRVEQARIGTSFAPVAELASEQGVGPDVSDVVVDGVPSEEDCHDPSP